MKRPSKKAAAARVLRELCNMELLKRELDSTAPSLESVLRLFKDPSPALRARLRARLRELRPAGAPPQTFCIPEESHDGYFELERAITGLTWRHAELLADSASLPRV